MPGSNRDHWCYIWTMLDHVLAAALAISLQADARPRANVPPANPPAQGQPAVQGISADAEGTEGVEAYGGAPTPPPCSPQDLALWKKGAAATTQVWQGRATARRLQARAKSDRLVERLEVLAAASPAAEAGRILKHRDEIQEAWNENSALYSRRWPVDPTRVCGYAHLYFDSSLRLPEGPSKKAELGAARADLQGCVERADVPVKAMARANHELQEALDEARATLKAAEAKGLPTWPANPDPATAPDAPPAPATPAPAATPAAPGGAGPHAGHPGHQYGAQ